MEPLDGIVLAGGRSRRLGIDKARITFGRRPLLELVVERLAPICREVVVAGREPPRGRLARLPCRFVPDLFPGGQGPLAGLHAGLRATRSDFALVVACDMPFLNSRLLAHMASLPRRYQALVPRAGGRWHPLHAVYARSCLPLVEEMLVLGFRSMEALLSRLEVLPLGEEELRRFDPEGLSLFNLNDRPALARARTLWRRAARPGETAVSIAPPPAP